MEEIGHNVADARKRIALLAGLARLTWVANFAIGLGSVACHQYETASVAGYLFVISLFLAAYSRRAARQLSNLEHVIGSARPPHNLIPVDTVS